MKAKLIEILNIGPDVINMKFSKPDELNFKSGQFFIIDVPHQDKIIKRAYSFASGSDENHFDICVKKIENGIGTGYLFNLKPEDEILFNGPMGKMVIPQDNEDLVMICVGTGVAPFRSMIRHILLNQDKRNITLIMGGRNEEYLFYREEFEEFAKNNVNFNYFTILDKCSQPKCKEGYVQDLIINDIIEKGDAEKFHYFLCGIPVMVRETKELLKKHGVDVEKIKLESF